VCLGRISVGVNVNGMVFVCAGREGGRVLCGFGWLGRV
jgi:hypothetical protein